MKICLIGGIYGAGGHNSGYIKVTPETTLEGAFRAAGHEVHTLSHYDSRDFDGFDIVHVHHLSYGAVRLASDAGRTPFVFTAHDASRMSGARVRPVVEYATRYVMSRADGVVGLSRAEVEFLKINYPLRGAMVSAIPNGIAASQYPFLRRNAAGRNAPWRLLFCGQLIPLKGVDLLLRAMATLRLDATLTLVYQTPLLEAELRALAHSLGIFDRIRFAGKLAPEALAREYQSHHVLILPSETEALPSVITESMLSGLPFVATKVGGIAEQANGFGYLLPERSVSALAAGIAHVTANYGEYADKAEAMSAYARGTFSVEAMASRHLELYTELKNRKARRRRSLLAAGDVFVRAAVERWGGKNRQVAVAAAGGL